MAARSSIVYQESHCNHKAISKTQVKGLMIYKRYPITFGLKIGLTQMRVLMEE